jgi:DNA-binding transcriptional MerR regulator
MKTITVLAREFGLSRTTLLYYDRIGLLKPSYRTAAEARLYSAEEENVLRQIITYRRAGIPLESIKVMLDAAPARVNVRLERRLREIQDQIGTLRAQQRFVVQMLKDAVLRGEKPVRNKDQWVELLRACEFTNDDLRRWHVEMERDAPEAHSRFLRRIGFSAAEAEAVRERARVALPTVSQPARPPR